MAAATAGALFNNNFSSPLASSQYCGLQNGRLLSLPSTIISSSLVTSSHSSDFFHSGFHSLTLSHSVRVRPVSGFPSGSAPLIKSAFLLEWAGNIIKCITKLPSKLFVQKLEADLDKAAKFIKTSASVVAEVAKEVDEFAEKVESLAERTEEIANKVVHTTETAEERIEEILDVLDGEDSTDQKQNQNQTLQTGIVANPPTSHESNPTTF